MMAPETVVTVETNHGANKPPEGGTALGWIKYNVDYFKTVPGILKLVELVLGILCIAFASPARLSGTHFFLLVSVLSFIFTVVWAAAYFLSVREALKLPINWLLTEFLNTGIITVLYVIASIVQLAAWDPIYGANYYRGLNLTAGSFGLFNAVAYGYATYLLYLEHKNSAPAS